MTQAEIDALRTAAEKATPGPWTTERPVFDKTAGFGFTPGVLIAATAPRQGIYADPPGGTFPENDRRFIATANPAAILPLLDTLAATQAELALMTGVAGGALSGTDEAERIAKESSDPIDASMRALKARRARSDETLQACLAPMQAELARAKKAEAEMRERCARFVMGAIVLNDEESYEMAEHVRALPLSDAP